MYYTNDILSQLQDTLPTQQDISYQREESEGHAVCQAQNISLQKERTDNKKIEERLKIMEDRLKIMKTDMKKSHGLLQKILKCVQDRHSAPQKPAVLPISTLQQMDEFENLTEEDYSDVVNYFHYVGGFHLKEAINLCIKEGLFDSLTQSFTWFGREEGRRPLYNTRLVQAIYDALCKNRHFDRPLKSEFQMQMRESLRVAKERHRSRIRGHADETSAQKRTKIYGMTRQTRATLKQATTNNNII
ncbi:uncharacterized protein LOC112588563 [Harpegnathos saltator]|uniref:uncharacterized protein LOC112588563 n=1 Tax=Harpegnathos saltator TaxID=610380 RepID=UPI000DBECF82|nr:uncharacterized protein LOC112588563 [Harpegnathos saltator]